MTKKKRYHLTNMWGSFFNPPVMLCGRKLPNAFTVDHQGMRKNVCERCKVAAKKDGKDWRSYSPIEGRT